MDRLSKYNECVNDYDLLPYFDFPKVIAHEIILYMYATCSECKKCLLTEYTCEYCGKTRCKFHYLKKTFMCVVNDCNGIAMWGYKDLICYCNKHVKDKKVIDYSSTCRKVGCYNKVIYKNNKYNEVLCKI